MSRSTGGTYNLPAGNPVQTGTTISSTWANATLQDLELEMTNSLSRDGYGAMRAPLKVPQGTAPAPAVTFSEDLASGLYLAAASDVRMSVASNGQMKWTSAGTTAINAFFCSSTLAVTGNTTLSGTLGVTGATTLSTLSTSGAASLASLGVTGTSTLTGTVVASNGGASLELRPGSADHVFLRLNARTASPTSQSGYFGYANVADMDLRIRNDLSGGSVILSANNGTVVSNNNIAFSGVSNPAATTGFANTLTPINVPKAWALIAVTGGVVSLVDGFNVGTPSLATVNSVANHGILLPIQTAMGASDYVATVTRQVITFPPANLRVPFVASTVSGGVTIGVQASDGATASMTEVNARFHVVVYGRQ